jgi:hypothetical protein
VETFVFGPVDSSWFHYTAIVPRTVAFSSHDNQCSTELIFHLSSPYSFVS